MGTMDWGHPSWQAVQRHQRLRRPGLVWPEMSLQVREKANSRIYIQYYALRNIMWNTIDAINIHRSNTSWDIWSQRRTTVWLRFLPSQWQDLQVLGGEKCFKVWSDKQIFQVQFLHLKLNHLLPFFLGTTIFSETEELWKRCLRNPLKSFFVAQDTRRNAFFKMIPGERCDNSSVSWMLALAH